MLSLFGSVGLPDRDPTIPKEERPERAALLRLRKEFGLFANLRPVRLFRELAHCCPLSRERQGEGIDMNRLAAPLRTSPAKIWPTLSPRSFRPL